jgi:hypothetical protein
MHGGDQNLILQQLLLLRLVSHLVRMAQIQCTDCQVLYHQLLVWEETGLEVSQQSDLLAVMEAAPWGGVDHSVTPTVVVCEVAVMVVLMGP